MISDAQALPRRRGEIAPGPGLDGWLLGAALVLLGLGVLMVSSASISIADKTFGAPFHCECHILLMRGFRFGSTVVS